MKKRKIRRERSLVVLGMILTRKGVKMKDKRNRRDRNRKEDYEE